MVTLTLPPKNQWTTKFHELNPGDVFEHYGLVAVCIDTPEATDYVMWGDARGYLQDINAKLRKWVFAVVLRPSQGKVFSFTPYIGVFSTDELVHGRVFGPLKVERS